MAESVEHLPRMHEALNLIPGTEKEKKIESKGIDLKGRIWRNRTARFTHCLGAVVDIQGTECSVSTLVTQLRD